ncbi:lytic transglycosylase domain-containing protein [Halopseudomonas sabulinigri]|uniref:Lytic transglycosylase domain-containing protein n=1 Tax=Halopseudomonas sabulinigri TaxID=472181 RepID=A0A1H1XI85_9GAMM|nr:lytic transglycosylase domain-containing protein [Halopseudomonas sabulinigri]SDT08426.1 Transglycosylase SLT domain-containing protein [Halopseudomonas sabulinigri]
MLTRIVTLIFMLLSGSLHAAATEPVDPELKAALMRTVAQAESFNDRFDAEVWLLDMSTRLAPFIKDENERLTMLRLVHREARQAKLKPDLVIAVMHTESLFDRYALSSVGAQGVMQVMPFWKAELGRPEDNLIDLATNLRYGCAILKFYLDKEHGNLRRALARYNGSLGSSRYPDKVLDYWYTYWYVNE